MSPRISAVCWRSTACRSTSCAASCSRFSAARAAARPHCCACWRASSTPTAGRILIDGVDMTDAPPYERPVNLMFQSYALFPHMTVEQNVAYGLKKERVPAAADQRARRGDARAREARNARRRASPTNCPAGSSNAWRWRARWSSAPNYCCSMSRWRRSTRSCASTRSSSWPTCNTSSAPRSSW